MLIVTGTILNDVFEVFESDETNNKRPGDGIVFFNYYNDFVYAIKHKSGPKGGEVMIRSVLSWPRLPHFGYVPCDQDIASEEIIAKRLEEYEWNGRKMYKVERRFHPRTKLDYSELPPDTIF